MIYDSAFESALHGMDDYNYHKCYTCNDTGKVIKSESVTGKQDSEHSKYCSGCNKYVSKLIKDKKKAGVTCSWCKDCWKEYRELAY